MRSTSLETPLKGPPPAEVPLEHAPLVRVIAQVRFPLIASVERRDFIGPFQEAIRREYPVLRPEQTQSLALGPEGSVVQARAGTVWRFEDSTGDWRAALASDFLALETTRYTSRDDFLQRFERVVAACRECVDPQVVDRLGVRYIHRLSGGDVAILPELVRPEVAGILATPVAADVRHAISEHVFDLDGEAGQLMARWGLVPPNATFDPAAVNPIPEPSWLLDLDAFQAGTRPFDVPAIMLQTRGFAERIYSFFRWAITDRFLERYGGGA